MGTHLSFSTTFHPQSRGQVERVNQILEDMLKACVISFEKNWEKYLPFAEFAYNNSESAFTPKWCFGVMTMWLVGLMTGVKDLSQVIGPCVGYYFLEDDWPRFKKIKGVVSI